MDWIVAIVVGGAIGWIASMIMHTDEEQGPLANILVGIVGAALGKLIFADLLGIGSASTAGGFNLYGILWGVVGAVIFIGILKSFKVLT